MALPIRASQPLRQPDQLPFPESIARWFAAEPAPVQPERPAFRVIPGGREAALRHRRPVSVYRRRRLVAGTILALLVLPAVLVGGLAAVHAVGSHVAATASTSSTSGPAEVTPVPATSLGGDVVTSYVVQPGDSLWSIASKLQPEGDPRPLVDELAHRAGNGPLEAGRRLDLTGLSGD